MTVGYDRRLNREFFGISGTFGNPDFTSDTLRVHGDSVTLLGYGGTKLGQSWGLSGHIGGDHTRYRQFRTVRDESYSSRYSSSAFMFGLELSRGSWLGCSDFCVRPAIGYDLLALCSDGYREDPGQTGKYALDVSSYHQALHRVKVGADLNWQPTRWFIASGDAYYLSVLGDRTTYADARFVNDYDPAHAFTTSSFTVDPGFFGLGARATFLTKKHWEFSLGYNTMFGKTTTGQQAMLTAVCKF